MSNHLAAAGLCLGAGLDLKTVAAGLSSLKGVPGRLERVDQANGFAVLVDYAHTDDALQNVLTTLRPLCRGRLTVLFGCGGDRDRTKRPRMARVAEQLADTIIVTSDNPRTEEPEAIIGEILTGFEDPGSERITVEPDRRKAIELAIENARHGRHRPAGRQGPRDLPDHRHQEIRFQRQRHCPAVSERKTMQPIPIEALARILGATVTGRPGGTGAGAAGTPDHRHQHGLPHDPARRLLLCDRRRELRRP